MKRLLLVLLFLCVAEEGWADHAIQPIPRSIPYEKAKAELGKRLFFDPALSGDGTVACVSCHSPETGADTRPFSLGVHGQQGHANAPTVFNTVFNFRQMWNGAVTGLKEQVAMPLHNPIEMAMDRKKVEAYLRARPEYARQFEAIYGHPATFPDLSDAIAEFEKALITPDSRFDRYLRGEIELSPDEREGYRLFKRLGCITCHNGINLGGNSFQKMGLIHRYRWREGFPDRFSLTRKEADKNVYKVPTLRNVALTAPYFHDGSAATLQEALRKMAHHNLGFDLNEKEIDKLIAFLKTLTGQTPAILKAEGKKP